ncbi:hypothetical protein BH11BAC5_BH11BAC5_48570 [soil metagenome]
MQYNNKNIAELVIKDLFDYDNGETVYKKILEIFTGAYESKEANDWGLNHNRENIDALQSIEQLTNFLDNEVRNAELKTKDYNAVDFDAEYAAMIQSVDSNSIKKFLKIWFERNSAIKIADKLLEMFNAHIHAKKGTKKDIFDLACDGFQVRLFINGILKLEQSVVDFTDESFCFAMPGYSPIYLS